MKAALGGMNVIFSTSLEGGLKGLKTKRFMLDTAQAPGGQMTFKDIENFNNKSLGGG